MDELLQVFVAESRDRLAQMEGMLLELERHPTDTDTVNAVFRVAHTIKGGAGVIECDYIVKFTHVMESVLDQVRNGSLSINSDLVALLLGCSDHLGGLLSLLESGQTSLDEATASQDAQLQQQLRRYLGTDNHSATAASTTEAAPSPAQTNPDTWHISVRFGANVLRNGMDPASFIRYLASFGDITQLVTLLDALPQGDEYDPEVCYLGFEIAFATAADQAAIESVFDFVRDDCLLHILPPQASVADYEALLRVLPESSDKLTALFADTFGIAALPSPAANVTPTDNITAQEVVQAPAVITVPAAFDSPPVAPPLVSAPSTPSPSPQQPAPPEKRATASPEARFIRVQADKLDKLIDLVGELVIAGASANLLASNSGQAPLVEATSVISHLVEEIRDSALQLRMVQIGETFNRFQRVVRDVSREMDKQIALAINGGETELDKSVVEKIGDPLMHLVRNAIDHGVEPLADRLAAGKSEQGHVTLNAYHDSGSIVIEVEDDGRGLNSERILAKAIERGLVQPNQTLSENEIFNLIFEPGFSTAEKVTNISGRGVGMDVVRRNILALRGSVEIDSVLGQGSVFRIRLPLTLAIIDGFLMRIGKASFVVPLDFVVECVELDVPLAHRAEQRYINLRGEVLPFLRLRDMFELNDSHSGRRENIVVVQYAGQKAGLMVDELLGEFQTVIKPLGGLFKNLKGISGSTILGSGEVALILDVPGLLQKAVYAESQYVNQHNTLHIG